MATPSLYVTGTDTGAGKTFAAVAVLHALRAQGLRAVGMKPVASGCEATAGGWRNEDALALLQASDGDPAYSDVNPFALPDATAPQLAARSAGVEVALGPILDAHARLGRAADVVVVEGAGGWLAPFSDDLEQSLLARSLAAQVVMVVGLRLGCLNHARLTERAVIADGCRLLGWIGCHVRADETFAGDYLALVREALASPCLGVIPHSAEASSAMGAVSLSLNGAALG